MVKWGHGYQRWPTMTDEDDREEAEFELLLACYLSGQVSERQWLEHLKDQKLRDWLKRIGRDDLT